MQKEDVLTVSMDFPNGCDLQTLGKFLLNLDDSLKTTYEQVTGKKKTVGEYRVAFQLIGFKLEGTKITFDVQVSW